MHNDQKIDWQAIARATLLSRALDAFEEGTLLPRKEIFYQFSSRGHDTAQICLASYLGKQHDAASGYYRSRPLLLSLGLSLEDAIAGPMGRSGGFSDGRDIGVVCNLPNTNGCSILPMAGGVGTQFTPIVGWAQAMRYRSEVLAESSCSGSVAVALGGEASTATNGFWSALNIATTMKLPVLFFIEDNGFGLSVRSDLQTPGGNIAKNLDGFSDLLVLEANGWELDVLERSLSSAFNRLRNNKGPVLLRVVVPRLSGHSGQDNQAYKNEEDLSQDQKRDPLPVLQNHLYESGVTKETWTEWEKKAAEQVEAAYQKVLQRSWPESSTITSHVFFEGSPATLGDEASPSNKNTPSTPDLEGERVNMAQAIRKTIASELELNQKLLVFGEDVGAKGGVHAVTLGLQEKFGEKRVFDTSLSEEGIIGRAAGMAYAGLRPHAEIQFRKYADPAQEQLNDIGTVRWRTKNRFSCPVIVRLPGGFAKCGDPWHSECNEVQFARAPGWRVAFPSNAQDASGLLRSALRGNDPTIFFEHRSLLDDVSARSAYPGDDYVLPFGCANVVLSGNDLTVVTWGAMLPRCQSAIEQINHSVELIDLRTLSPWDTQSVFESLEKTGRLLVVHEDRITAGFGAEIVASVTESCFYSLKAPAARLSVQDIPLPYQPALLEATLPSVERIRNKILELIEL